MVQGGAETHLQIGLNKEMVSEWRMRQGVPTEEQMQEEQGTLVDGNGPRRDTG